LLLDNEKGSQAFPPALEGRKPLQSPSRAVLVGQVWSAELAETLMEVYAQLMTEGYSLEDVSRLVQESSNDSLGD